MSYGLIAVIIVIGIVIGAIATKKCEPFLIGGSIIGAIFLYKQDFITEWVNTLEGVMSDEAYLILVCGLFGSIIALLTASKGHFGFAKIVSKICNSERKTLFTTFILGVIIFIDDYLNVLSIGTAMKKVYDKVKVPREALAYLLDSTGSPVCVMFPFSSWAAYFGAIFFAQESVQALGAKTWMGAYIKAIPFCIYPIVALLIVILFSAGVFPKLGGMKKAYERVATTGKVYSDASKKYNMDDGEGEQDGNIFNFLVPMLVLVVVACVTGNLVVAQIICLAVTLVMYLAEKLMTFTEYWDNFVKGFADMLPIIILLIAALTFQTIANQMQMTEFFIDITQPILSAKIFPMLAFIITGILAFMIANAWGVCTLVAPVLLPLGASVGANAILIMAAILSGCAFGNHACFYCDTTVLASQGSGIDNFDHAVSQIDELEEKVKKTSTNSYKRMMYPLGTQSSTEQDRIFEAQQNIMKFLVERESCIIVGRCSDFVLSDEENAVHIYIYAPYEQRVKNCVNDLHLSEEEAKKMIRSVDEARDNYHMHYAGFLPSDPKHKTIMIDSSSLGVEGTAEYLVDFIQKKFDLKTYTLD